MSVCPNIAVGMVLEADCPDCGHKVGDHDYPSRHCRTCLGDRLDEAEEWLNNFPLSIEPAPDPPRVERMDAEVIAAVDRLTEAVLELADLIRRDRVF